MAENPGCSAPPLPVPPIRIPAPNPFKKQTSGNHIQRPNFLRSLDLKAIPANDSLTNNSPSETQKRRIKYQFFEKQCSKIAEGLYLSGDVVAKNWELLQENKVSHVINCVGFICQEYFKDKGLTYRTYFLQDTPAEDILCVLYDAFEFIDTAITAGGRVLVHCSQGVSRSATIVIGFLMWKTGATYDDAFATVKAARGVANPNIGFCCQLLQWQKRRTPKAMQQTRLYRVSPHCKSAPTHLVPKSTTPPKQYRNNTFRDLDSRFAFIVQTPEKMYVWVGSLCPQTFATSAQYYAQLYPKYESTHRGHTKPIEVVQQDEEPPDFVLVMDPPLLNPDQQRINARRNSITGDLLAGTSGLTGFSSLGLTLGSPRNSITPRTGSPAPDPLRAANASIVSEPMEISDNEGLSSSLPRRRSHMFSSPAGSPMAGSPLTGSSTFTSGSQHFMPSSRLQVASARRDATVNTTLFPNSNNAAYPNFSAFPTIKTNASANAFDPMTSTASIDMLQGQQNELMVMADDSGATEWWVDEVEAYTSEHEMYMEAIQQSIQQSVQPSKSLGGRAFVAKQHEGATSTLSEDDDFVLAQATESPSECHMKKYRRSDCGLADTHHRRLQVDKVKQSGNKSLHSSFGDGDWE